MGWRNDDLIYELWRNDKIFRCFDSLPKASSYLSVASEVCPQDDFYLKTRQRIRMTIEAAPTDPEE